MGKRRRQRQKACDSCQCLAPVLYRVCIDNTQDWLLVCPSCQQRCASQTGYRYGGTWKAIKRPRA